MTEKVFLLFIAMLPALIYMLRVGFGSELSGLIVGGIAVFYLVTES